MVNRIVSVHAGFIGWGYMRLCCHLVGFWSLIVSSLRIYEYYIPIMCLKWNMDH